MTMLQRIMRVVHSGAGQNQNLSGYYGNLLNTRVGDSGLPTVTEARRDLDAALRKPILY